MSEGDEVSTDELRMKIELYEEQLSKLGDGSSGEGLRTMLENVLKVTRELVRSREERTREERTKKVESENGLGAEESNRTEKVESENRLGAEESNNEELNKEELNKEETTLGVGSVVEVQGGSRVYAGVITATHDPPESTGIEVTVKYYEYEGEVGLKWENLVPLSPSDVSILARKDPYFYRKWKGQGKYSGDQQYYDCTIEELTMHGAMVIYTAYGNKEELPLAYLRTRGTDAEYKSSAPASTLSGDVKTIPEKYRILDTDSEAQRQLKLKKTKFLRQQNREVQREKESTVVQQNWQKFMAKGARKNLAGMSGITGKGSHDPISTGAAPKAANTANRKRQRFH